MQTSVGTAGNALLCCAPCALPHLARRHTLWPPNRQHPPKSDAHTQSGSSSSFGCMLAVPSLHTLPHIHSSSPLTASQSSPPSSAPASAGASAAAAAAAAAAALAAASSSAFSRRASCSAASCCARASSSSYRNAVECVCVCVCVCVCGVFVCARERERGGKSVWVHVRTGVRAQTSLAKEHESQGGDCTRNCTLQETIVFVSMQESKLPIGHRRTHEQGVHQQRPSPTPPLPAERQKGRTLAVSSFFFCDFLVVYTTFLGFLSAASASAVSMLMPAHSTHWPTF